jgi:uncharacterized cofD-like protein
MTADDFRATSAPDAAPASAPAPAPALIPINNFKAVCIGGGTGTPVSIEALLAADIYTDVVVAMADDGGSSGLLRGHTGLVPPGDLRKCLTALAQQPNNVWVRAFKQRFEYANNHTLGNLILTALQETSESLPRAIALCESLLQTRGHVLPSTLQSVVLNGVTKDGRQLCGQSTICKARTALESVSLDPQHAKAYQQALLAIQQADLIILGPGSLFTSIIPNLLVDGVIEAIVAGGATTVFVCSLCDVQGETWGFNAAELLEALLNHGMRGKLDYMIANRPAFGADSSVAGNVTGMFKTIGSGDNGDAALARDYPASTRYVALDSDIEARIRASGVKRITRDLADSQRPGRPDIMALKAAFLSIVDEIGGIGSIVTMEE